MEYYQIPTLSLFDNKNEENEYLAQNKIKKEAFDPKWEQTVHQKENYELYSRICPQWTPSGPAQSVQCRQMFVVQNGDIFLNFEHT